MLLTGEVQAEWIAEMKVSASKRSWPVLHRTFPPYSCPLQKPFWEDPPLGRLPDRAYWLPDGVPHPTAGGGHALIARVLAPAPRGFGRRGNV